MRSIILKIFSIVGMDNEIVYSESTQNVRKPVRLQNPKFCSFYPVVYIQ